MTEAENVVLILVGETGAEMGAEPRGEIADVRSEVQPLRADVASDLPLIEKRLGDRIATLDRAVMQYHASAIGHGVLDSELEARILRVEDRLNRFSPEAH